MGHDAMTLISVAAAAGRRVAGAAAVARCVRVFQCLEFATLQFRNVKPSLTHTHVTMTPYSLKVNSYTLHRTFRDILAFTGIL